ncbi:sensor histidine kinase [Cryptosporangium minutisporangium]|uniref:histidine kinase n=1 Tax=Cryptosporangium minutisporangium TaxID=113569 RepID=A0ABP6SSB9_9ACTN
MRGRGRIGLTLLGLAVVGLASASLVRSADERDGGTIVLLAVAIAVQGAMVVFRLRAPLTAWAVSLLCVLSIPADDAVWLVCVGVSQVLLAHVALVAQRRVTMVAAAVAVVTLCAANNRVHGFELIGNGGVVLLLWTASAAATGLAIRSHFDYVAAIEERARWAVETRTAEGRRLVAEERLRIARELHDVLGHHVAVIRVHAGLARRTLTSAPSKAAAALSETEAAAQAVLREMSGILRLLREDEQETPPAPAPGLADLDPLIETVRRGGLDVTVERDVDPQRVPDLTAVTTYRVVQECLTNARRHATGPLHLTMHTDATTMTITAANPARDVPAAGGGYGLIGMRERVRAVGGHLDVTRADGRFRVVAELPLDVGADLARKDA